MTKDAIFRLYSMTKPFASVAAMMLVEDGRIRLGDPVSRHIPKLANLQVSVPRFDPDTGKATYALVPAEREGLKYVRTAADDTTADNLLKVKDC